jgi:hypothetical protein
MNDYEDVYDEWLWSCLWWMIMKLFMMNGYEVVYDDWLWSGLWWWCYVDAIWFMIWCYMIYDMMSMSIRWWYVTMLWLLIDDMWRCYVYYLMICDDCLRLVFDDMWWCFYEYIYDDIWWRLCLYLWCYKMMSYDYIYEDIWWCLWLYFWWCMMKFMTNVGRLMMLVNEV